jgi:hypothetical protein
LTTLNALLFVVTFCALSLAFTVKAWLPSGGCFVVYGGREGGRG